MNLLSPLSLSLCIVDHNTVQKRKSRMPANALRFALSICASLFLLSAKSSDVKAQASDVRAGVGSEWTFETTDEITKSKSEGQIVITELTPDQIVLRTTSTARPGVISMAVVDRNWNTIEFAQWKYSPPKGDGIQRSPGGAITAPPDVEIQGSYRQTTGWSAPVKFTMSARLVGTENVITKAGTFETFKLEYVQKNPTGVPLSETVITTTRWFAPKIDYFVKSVSETRVDGRLQTKTATELLKYNLK